MASPTAGWQKFIRSKIFVLILFVASAMALFAYGRAFYQDYEIRQEIRRLQEEARRLEGKTIASLDVLRYVQSPAFAEEKARTELNMLKPGEEMAVILPEKPAGADNGQTEEKVLKWDNTSNMLKWWRYFFGREE